MDVQPAKEPASPAYPERTEFLRQRSLLGASLLGAGMLLGACEQRSVRTGGVGPEPKRPMGALPMPAAHPNKAQQPGKAATTPKTSPPPAPQPAPQPTEPPPGRTMGKIRVEPKPIEPPPRLMGDVMVVPKPGEPPQDPPKQEDPPRVPGEPPPR